MSDLEIGRRLEERRRARGVSRAALAARTGIGTDETLIKRVEAGKRPLRAVELPIIAEALDLPADWWTYDLMPSTKKRKASKARRTVAVVALAGGLLGAHPARPAQAIPAGAGKLQVDTLFVTSTRRKGRHRHLRLVS